MFEFHPELSGQIVQWRLLVAADLSREQYAGTLLK
jgi:hypothetical protein